MNQRTIYFLFAAVGLLPSTISATHPFARGEFEAVDPATPVRGSFEIEEEGDSAVLILGEDFFATQGPDLYVVLSPLHLEEATNANALEGGAVLGLLKALTGSQRYPIPGSVELEEKRSVLIHCVEYSHLFGGGSISRSYGVLPGPGRARGGAPVRASLRAPAAPVDLLGRRRSKNPPALAGTVTDPGGAHTVEIRTGGTQ